MPAENIVCSSKPHTGPIVDYQLSFRLEDPDFLFLALTGQGPNSSDFERPTSDLARPRGL